MKKILGDIRKADEMFSLIQDGDRIAVGLSGGKDSTLLLYALHLYRYVFQNIRHGSFEVIGLHVDLNFGEDDMSPLYSFLEENHISYYSEKSYIADILALHKKEDKLSCSLCSQLKKGAVIKAAKKLGCNKVAFAHHADDALETLLMNMIYGGRIATFDAKMYLDHSGITFIRPFALSFEKDIKRTVKELSIPIVKSGCPNDGHTERQEMKEMLISLYHKYPQARENFLRSLYNEKQLNLYKRDLAFHDGINDKDDV